MSGICLNSPIVYLTASLRDFREGERHVSRFCPDDVLLLVYEGVLRFSENGREYEVSAGEYFIQTKGSIHRGAKVSSAPRYLYVHFQAEESDEASALSRRGVFDASRLMARMQRLDAYEKGGKTLTEKCAVFYSILAELNKRDEEPSLAERIAQFISDNLVTEVSLDALSRKFNFSKNHIINSFWFENK